MECLKFEMFLFNSTSHRYNARPGRLWVGRHGSRKYAHDTRLTDTVCL